MIPCSFSKEVIKEKVCRGKNKSSNLQDTLLFKFRIILVGQLVFFSFSPKIKLDAEFDLSCLNFIIVINVYICIQLPVSQDMVHASS